jgi:hypothetical protein
VPPSETLYTDKRIEANAATRCDLWACAPIRLRATRTCEKIESAAKLSGEGFDPCSEFDSAAPAFLVQHPFRARKRTPTGVLFRPAVTGVNELGSIKSKASPVARRQSRRGRASAEISNAN